MQVRSHSNVTGPELCLLQARFTARAPEVLPWHGLKVITMAWPESYHNGKAQKASPLQVSQPMIKDGWRNVQGLWTRH